MSKSELSPIKAAVRKSLQNSFPEKQPFFVIGVSGGMDSMALLHTFRELDVPALVSHINYQKRGAASDKDEELVRRTSERWGYEYKLTRVDPRQAKGDNFQQWARQVRYEAFHRQMEEYDADGIALAHHQDDQLETILQKIFRGAGLQSWGGMKVWERRLFRPLLNVTRKQIEEAVHEQDIPYRTDASNLRSEFARNFLRNEWLRKMETFFPGWKQNLLRMETHARDHANALDWISNRITDEWGIRREDYHTLQEGLQKALILHLLKQEDPGLQISRDSLARLQELETLQTGQEITLGEGYSLHRDRNHYVLKEDNACSFSPQTLHMEELRQKTLFTHNLEIAVKRYEQPDYENSLYLDCEKLDWPLTLRLWHRGDQFIPFGMNGHQQVSDHLTNRKVSSAYKNQSMVIESFEETICAVIFPPINKAGQPGTIAEHARCGADTEFCLTIKHRR